MQQPQPDLRVELSIRTRSEGGTRRTPVGSGIRYRTKIREDMGNDARFDFLDTDSLAPGERCIALATFVFPELLDGRIAAGRVYGIGDDQADEARFTVLEILTPSLTAFDEHEDHHE